MNQTCFKPICLLIFACCYLPFLSVFAQHKAAKPPTTFEFVGLQQVSEFYIDNEADPLIKWAVNQLLDDIHTITGRRPTLNQVKQMPAEGVLIGQLNDDIVQHANLPRDQHQGLRGKWEHFTFNLGAKNLLIVGSDVRGTVYGVFDLAERLGVSPWQWWADVTPTPQKILTVDFADIQTIQGPSVQYRGVFLNDEGWGLRPWSARTFDPNSGNIGPRTYEKIFQLLLRLKANSIWPAMHPGTNGFFTVDGNPAMAAKYHIVVGSSHAEPMLRNNVAEWDHDKFGDYNYFKNRAKLDEYWHQRINDVKKSDVHTIVTLGMRGVHDSKMEGAKSDADSIAILREILASQRTMLSSTLEKPITDIPQVFIPYKEVLPLYDGGLQVPEDVTLMWTDDNYGYIRRFSEGAELQRPGGSGVYYHLSYWGRPHDYLWLSTTQPGLIWYEMTRAYANGANKIWIANVGDIKPAEYTTEFFLDLAWNIDGISAENIATHLSNWAAREFGDAVAEEVSAIMSEYYRLAMLRKPEYMGWSQTEPTTKTQISEFSDIEAEARINAYHRLTQQVAKLSKRIPHHRQSAWFELVAYPVQAAAAMNNKFLYQQLLANSASPAQREVHKQAALQAYTQIQQLTEHYNQLEQGKWQYMMSMAPRNLPVFHAPTFDFVKSATEQTIDKSQTVYLDAKEYTRHSQQPKVQWQSVQGLGYSNAAMTLSPFKIEYFEQQQPWLEYDINIKAPGEYQLELRFLPTHANDVNHQVSVVINGKALSSSKLNTQGRSEEWKTNILRNSQNLGLPFTVKQPGLHTIRLAFNQTGIVLDQLAIYPASQRPFYEIPAAK